MSRSLSDASDKDNLFTFFSDISDQGCLGLPSPKDLSAGADLLSGTRLLAFKGGRNDSGIYASRFTDGVGGRSWAPRWKIDNIGTSTGPSVGAYGNDLFMAWKGDPGDSGIYYTQSATGNAGTWNGQSKLNGAGTSVGLAVGAFG
jgi:hypothetical protein